VSTIDSEVLEVLRDRPDLLRLAAAVSQTQPPLLRRHARAIRIGLVAAVSAGVLAVALVATWPSGGPNVVDRALAAIGSGPIVHAVVERSSPDNVVVNLTTGATRERKHQTEYWYDRERSLLHTRLLTDGEMLTEIVETPTGSDSDLGHYPGGIAGQLDPALAGFVTQYREALASGVAKVIAKDTIEGRDVTVLRIELGHGAVEDVAVDRDSYRPLLITYSQRGQTLTRWRVATIESLPRNPSYFAKPARSAPRPTGGTSPEGKAISTTQAARALERATFWLGTRFRALPLAQIDEVAVDTDYTDGTEHSGIKLELRYGETGANGRLLEAGPWVVVGEAASVAASYQVGFNDGGDPPAPEGSIVLENQAGFLVGANGVPAPGRPQWIGKLIRDGVYIQIQASSRQLVLDAARALERMP
jgi:hypothetical protein